MSINYLKYLMDLNYEYENLKDEIEIFQSNTNKENKEEVLNRINELQRILSMLKVTIKNIYLGGTNE